MQVNWAGQWEDIDGNFDFIHYPYWVLKKFRDSEYDNYVLAEVKKLAYSDPSLQGAKNLKALMKASFKQKFASKKDVIKTIRQLGMATQMESYISKTKSLDTGEQFFASIKRKAKYPQIKMYNEIKNANIIAKELKVNPNSSLDNLLISQKLAFEAPMKNYRISSFRKLKKDVKILSLKIFFLDKKS